MDRRERLRKLALETIDLAKVSPQFYFYPLDKTEILELVGSVHPPQPSRLTRMSSLSHTPHK